MTRSSARPGELESAAWIDGRLREGGIAEVEQQPYRYQRSYALAHALHSVAGLAAVSIGGVRGAAGALAALGSLEWEASGRRQWLRRLLPAGEGANVIARIPAGGRRRATFVLTAHHDAANTGFPWLPVMRESGASRHLRRRRVDPFMAPIGAAFALGAAGCIAPGKAGRRLRGTAALLLATSIASDVDVGRSPTVPGASDNATGVAVAIELARGLADEPLDGVETIVAICGSEEAGMGGMAAFLRKYEGELRARPSFVLSIDTLGAGTPIVATGEGTLREHRYRPADNAVVEEGAAIARRPAPQGWRIGGWTDAVLALFAGLSAASLLSMGPGYFPNYHRMTDTPDGVDWTSVEACAAITAGTLEAFERRASGTLELR